MSRGVQVVLLAEDTQHRTFARRFLSQSGVSPRGMRVLNLPAGGSKEQAVRERFPDELCLLRSGHVSSRALVVMVDADRYSLQERRRQFDSACQQHTPNPVDQATSDENVFLFVPKWEIETWLAYLRGERPISEDHRNYPKYHNERDCQPQVDALCGMCAAGTLPSDAPQSLAAACTEHARFKAFRAGLRE